MLPRSILHFLEEFRPELKPGQNFSLEELPWEGGATYLLLFSYRSKTREVIPVFLGIYTAEQLQRKVHLKKIGAAAQALGVKLPKSLAV